MTYQPTTAEVGNMYDGSNKFWTDMLAGGFHFGYYWDQQDDGQNMEAATDRLTRKIGELLQLKPGQHVLDIGCGTGKPALQIAKAHDVHITGITVSDSQVKLAQTQIESSTQLAKVSIQLGDVMELPFASKSFDGAYAMECLIHVPNKNTALGHIARVLRPGSRLVIADYFLERPAEGPEIEALDNVAKAFQLAPSHTTAEFQDFLSKAGLRIIELTYMSGSLSDGLEFFAKKILDAKGTVDSDMHEDFRRVISDMRQVAPIMRYAIITVGLA